MKKTNLKRTGQRRLARPRCSARPVHTMRLLLNLSTLISNLKALTTSVESLARDIVAVDKYGITNGSQKPNHA